MKPTFSVIMPAWNRAYCIQDSIKSVLRQNHKHFEVVVYDAGSYDGTADAVKALDDPRIKVGVNPVNNGVNFSRNRAAEMAEADWLVLLDSDDQLTEDAFDIMLKDIATVDDDVAIILYGTKNIRTNKAMSHFEDGEKGFPSYDDWLGEQKMKGEFLIVVRREEFNDKMFREDMVGFEKYFWLSIVKKKKAMVHNIVVRLYELEDENRETKKILTPEYAAPRADSYRKFMKEYGEDLRRVNPKLYAYYMSVMAHLLLSSGEKKAGRLALKDAMKHDFGAKTLGMYSLSFLGQWPFHLATRVVRYFS